MTWVLASRTSLYGKNYPVLDLNDSSLYYKRKTSKLDHFASKFESWLHKFNRFKNKFPTFIIYRWDELIIYFIEYIEDNYPDVKIYWIDPDQPEKSLAQFQLLKEETNERAASY